MRAILEALPDAPITARIVRLPMLPEDGAGRVAWDVYLVYPPGATWDDDPPVPAAWRHQLGDSSWADAAHYRTGEALFADLRAAVGAALRADRGSSEAG